MVIGVWNSNRHSPSILFFLKVPRVLVFFWDGYREGIGFDDGGAAGEKSKGADTLPIAPRAGGQVFAQPKMVYQGIMGGYKY